MTATHRWSTLVILICTVSLLNGGFLLYKIVKLRQISKPEFYRLFNHPYLCMGGKAARGFLLGLAIAEVMGMISLAVSAIWKKSCCATSAAIIFTVLPIIDLIDMIWKAERYHYMSLSWCFMLMAQISVMLVAIFTSRGLRRKVHLAVTPEPTAIYVPFGGLYGQQAAVTFVRPSGGHMGGAVQASPAGKNHYLSAEAYAQPPAYAELPPVESGGMYPKITAVVDNA